MAKTAKHLLSARTVETIRDIGRHADGGGLYLKVREGGSRQWVFMWTRTEGSRRKREEVGLGSLTLAQARAKAAEMRELVAAGKSPKAERKRLREGTFGAVAADYIRLHEPGWSTGYAAQTKLHLLEHCAELQGRPVSEITIDEIVRVLKPMWRSRPRVAELLRGRLKALFDYATAQGLVTTPNPATWGVLKHLLPKRSAEEARVEHHAALPLADLPAFMDRLLQSRALTAKALAFTIATAARSGEVLGMTWDEIDFDTATWTVPAERMKSRRPHVVPLSPLALDILASLRRGAASQIVFKRHACSMNRMMRRWKVPATPHGTARSSFRDWCGDHTAYPREVAEAALAHAVGDAAEQAYRRGSAIEKRRQMMADWSDFLLGQTPITRATT